VSHGTFPFKIFVTVDGNKLGNPAKGGNLEHCTTASFSANYGASPGDHAVELFSDVPRAYGPVFQREWVIDYTVTTP
jgi:hypothetical protein